MTSYQIIVSAVLDRCKRNIWIFSVIAYIYIFNLKEDFSFLGSGYSLYFEFLKSCQLILVCNFLVSGFYNLITNSFYGTDCLHEQQMMALSLEERKNCCAYNWISYTSLGNKISNKDLLHTQNILNLISILFIIIVLQTFRKKQREMDLTCD